MDENPYASPRADLSGAPSPTTRNALRDVAGQQRMMIRCALTQAAAILLLYVGAALAAIVPGSSFAIGHLLVGGLGLIVAVVGSHWTTMLAIRFYGPVLGTIYGTLACLPLLGLLIVAFVNARTRSFLYEHEVALGFLWTDPEEITDNADTGERCD